MDLKNLSYEQIIELAHNKSCEEIVNIALLLDESIRQYFSRLLVDTDAENPKQCYHIISTPEDMGLSDLEKPTLVSMYQDPSEGYIYLLFEGNEKYVELEELETHFAIYIIQQIDSDNQSNVHNN